MYHRPCPNRSTIVQHLLNDSMDPFNRQPLTEDMVQPQLELRQRIEDFLARRGGEAASSATAGAMATDAAGMPPTIP